MLLRGIDRHALGLEIGPSHRPVAAKRDGFNVRILDHLDAPGLRAKYADHGVDIAAIEEVDYVWRGETLEELVVYRQEYGERGLWVRPAAMFAETVEVEGETMPRFAFLGRD